MPWKKLLTWATGQIDKTLRQKLEFVLGKNRVYRALLDRHSPHWRLQDAERKGLAEKNKPLGKPFHDFMTSRNTRKSMFNCNPTHWPKRIVANGVTVMARGGWKE